VLATVEFLLSVNVLSKWIPADFSLLNWVYFVSPVS